MWHTLKVSRTRGSGGWGLLDGEQDAFEDLGTERTKRRPLWLTAQRQWRAACEKNMKVGTAHRKRGLQIMEIIQAVVLSGVEIRW